MSQSLMAFLREHFAGQSSAARLLQEGAVKLNGERMRLSTAGLITLDAGDVVTVGQRWERVVGWDDVDDAEQEHGESREAEAGITG